jgi:TolB protein
MRKLSAVFLTFFSFILCHSTWAMLSLELTRGVSGAIPIAVVPFATQGSTPPQDVSGIISHDLQNSGRFKVRGAESLTQFPSEIQAVSFDYFKRLGTDTIVIGHVDSIGADRYQVSFQLLDVFKGKTAPQESVLLARKFVVSANELRAVSHHISDLIYQQITGVRGVFSTRLAYIVVRRFQGAPTRYTLEVSDQDGYNPKPLLSSTDPIMSPAWSPKDCLCLF